MESFRSPPDDQVFYIIRGPEISIYANSQTGDILLCIFSDKKWADQLIQTHHINGTAHRIEWWEILEVFPGQFDGIMLDYVSPSVPVVCVLFKEIL